MTPDEAARRLNVAPHQVRDVSDIRDGSLVTLADGSVWLVTPAVARLFVEDVDGEPTRTGEVDTGGTSAPQRATETRPKGRTRKAAS